MSFFRDLRRLIRLAKWQNWLFTAGSVVAVLSAALWLFRDIRSLIPDRHLTKGSLIVNINTGTEEELETVPEVGPARAAQIIANRPFASVDDLLRVNGLGPKQLESMRPFVTKDGETRKK